MRHCSVCGGMVKKHIVMNERTGKTVAYHKCPHGCGAKIKVTKKGISGMKKQRPFDYIVSEDVPVMGATGLIEKTIQKILKRGTLTAYDEANASVQAVLLADMKGVDVTEVHVDVRSF